VTLPFAELQGRFAAALRDAKSPAPVPSSARRFGVYRNNVTAGILGVLEAHFGVVKQLVGEDFFRAMAFAYVAKEPPRSPILMLYGAGFPDFIAGFEPAADVPYLPDVARLEWLQHTAYHAADATPIGAAELAAVPPDAIAGLRFDLHPSLGLLASDYPVLSIWRMHQGGETARSGKLAAAAEHALVIRPLLDVETHAIDAGLHDLAAALGAGMPLGAAAEHVLSNAPHLDLQSALATLISAGAVVRYTLP
jgi:hypothetical protein